MKILRMAAGFTAAAALLFLLLMPAAPAPAQEVSLACLGGASPLTEATLARGATIVVVWTTWARGAEGIVGQINAIEQSWGDRAAVYAVVFQEDRQTVERFLQGKRLEVPVCLDAGNAEFSKRHNVTRVPRLLVFKDGVPAINVNLPDDPDRVIAGALG